MPIQCANIMNSLRHFPLGTRFPDSAHAVVSSLPTMADVIGYEEQDPRVTRAMLSGYPRFVVHAYVAQLIAFYLRREALVEREAVLIPSRRAALDLIARVDGEAIALEVEPSLYLVHVDATDCELSKRLRKYVQHLSLIHI